jgi:hypothetical protein
MKRLMMIVWLLALVSTNLFAQKRKTLSYVETVAYAKYLVENKRLFLREPAEKLFYNLETAGFPIEHMSTVSAGPWGEERTRGVIFYNYPSSVIDSDNPTVVILEVKLDMDFNEHDFWRSLPDEGWMECIMEKTKHYLVNDIICKVTKIYPEDSPLVKEMYKLTH